MWRGVGFGFGRTSGIRSLMAVLQMTWQPSLLIQKRRSGPPLGLKNLGNTCYLNSVLQCLTYTPPLANFCLKFQHSSSCDSADTTTEKKRECPFCLLEKRIARSLSIDSSLDAPAKINNCLRIFSDHFTRGRQEDAHEFLSYVIDACHNTCLRLKKLQLQRRKGGSVSDSGNGNTIVKEIFGGALQSQVKCLSCGSESNKVDEIMDISLDILQCVSLKDALQRFFQPETLDGNNKYKCDNCKKLVAARKQMSILQAPNVLVIQLKRFGGIFGEKIDKAIAFEEVLALSSYMCKGSQDLHPEYKLFGTIVHSGFSPDSGHYYSYIKDAMGRWYCCNDSYVSSSTLQEVVSEKAYILFFARSKQRPSTVKGGFLANGSKCHQSNGIDASKDKRSGQLERPMNTKLLPDHHSVSSNSIPSKVDKVPSGPSRKLGIFENCDIRKPHANGGIKIIVHEKESFEKTCNTTSLNDAEGNHKNVNVLKDMNGVKKARPADAIDPWKVNNSSIANGNGKIQHASADSLDRRLCEDDARKNNMTTRKTPEQRELSSSDGKCHSDSSGLKKKSNDKALSISHATDFTIGRNPGDRKSSNGDLKLHNSSGLKRKSKDADPSILLGNDATRGRDPEQKELFSGDAKCESGSLGLKRKAQDKDPSLLLAKDTQSRTRVDEFKKVKISDPKYLFWPERRELSSSDGKCHSDSSGLKRKSNDEGLSISHATDFTIRRNPEDKELSNGDLKLHNSLGSKRKSKELGNDATIGRDPEQKELFSGDAKCESGSSGLKRKAQDKDPSLLLAKDTQSRTRVDEFKKLIRKEASLVLRSSGWLDEVHNFMRSRKKLCIEEGRYDATRSNEMKRLLMADAKSAFLSKVPESLKGNLVKQLVLLSQQKQSSGT